MKYILFCQIYLGNEKRLAVANLFFLLTLTTVIIQLLQL